MNHHPLTPDEINRAFAHANFGAQTPHQVIMGNLERAAIGAHIGMQARYILEELRLIEMNRPNRAKMTRRGLGVILTEHQGARGSGTSHQTLARALCEIRDMKPHHAGQTRNEYFMQQIAKAALHEAITITNAESAAAEARGAAIELTEEITKPAPQTPEQELADEIAAELIRARQKFPGKNVTFAALAEEFGELATALFEESRARVRKEAVQVAVMAMRIVLDGDHTFEPWRADHGLDALTEGEGGARDKCDQLAAELIRAGRAAGKSVTVNIEMLPVQIDPATVRGMDESARAVRCIGCDCQNGGDECTGTTATPASQIIGKGAQA